MKKHQKNVTFSVPADMAGESGFAPDCEITIHARENLLAVVPQEMTAIQLVRALSSLTAVSCELIHALRAACGACGGCQDGCPFENAPEPEVTLPDSAPNGGPARAQRSGSRGERRSDGAGELFADRRKRVSEVRDDAGIPQDHKLHVEVCGNAAHVSDAGYEHDITDVPAALLEALALGGTCLGRLDELLISGEVIYHG